MNHQLSSRAFSVLCYLLYFLPKGFSYNFIVFTFSLYKIRDRTHISMVFCLFMFSFLKRNYILLFFIFCFCSIDFRFRLVVSGHFFESFY